MRDFAEKVAASGIDISDEVEKRLSANKANKTEVNGLKKVGDLQKFLAKQY